MLNHLLNTYPKVAFIETDCGQPEFTPPGLVSFNLVDQPVFGPPFTHLRYLLCSSFSSSRKPELSYFIGTPTPKDDPEAYLEAIASLIRYAEMKVSGMGSIIPIVINTHGWLHGMGMMMLQELIEKVGLNTPLPNNKFLPTDLVQITKPRSDGEKSDFVLSSSNLTSPNLSFVFSDEQVGSAIVTSYSSILQHTTEANDKPHCFFHSIQRAHTGTPNQVTEPRESRYHRLLSYFNVCSLSSIWTPIYLM